jgi:hypothetical protein
VQYEQRFEEEEREPAQHVDDASYVDHEDVRRFERDVLHEQRHMRLVVQEVQDPVRWAAQDLGTTLDLLSLDQRVVLTTDYLETQV